MTSDDLINIFYSGYPVSTDWQTVDALVLAIHAGAIGHRTERLASKQEFQKISRSIVTAEGLGPQTHSHMALKEISRHWLNTKFDVKTKDESYFAGLHPDVCSEDYRFIIECGTTDPSCIRIFLSDERVVWIGNTPYSFADDESIMLHIFSRGKNFFDWYEKNVNVSRDAFRKFHRR